ncbi:MAG: imidazole glycerol phosphate synthase subunit HisH [Chromatiales bacterium]|nr:imidazole glycerol phosphate synthase subunit HisH [Chromatiales bacterium]
MQRIAVVDYGMGNVRSVVRALEHVVEGSAEVVLSGDPAVIDAADRVVFPGQGAARDCMLSLGERSLDDALRRAARERPFLGICMGLQVLMDHSDENEGTACLGLYPGVVRRFDADTDGISKIPHMGWNAVHQTRGHPLWQGIDDGARFYFVHSYYVVPDDRTLVSATCDYGRTFAAGIARDKVFAVQFHPEKSASDGLRLLANFVGWSDR